MLVLSRRRNEQLEFQTGKNERLIALRNEVESLLGQLDQSGVQLPEPTIQAIGSLIEQLESESIVLTVVRLGSVKCRLGIDGPVTVPIARRQMKPRTEAAA